VIDQQLRGSKGEVNMHGHCMEAVDLIGMMMSAGPVMLVMEYYVKGQEQAHWENIRNGNTNTR
jgi:hypothetical protein